MTKITRQEKIRAALEALRDKHGRLTPQIVIKAARSSKHPLHDEFEWDIKKAAMQHWIETARELIRYVTVVVVSDNVKVVTPYYVRDPMKRGDEAGSIAITSDLLDRENAVAVMLAELDRCASAIKRARAVVGALDKEHRGLSRKFESMLRQIIETRELIRSAA